MSYDEELRITYAAIVSVAGKDSDKAIQFRQRYGSQRLPFNRIEELVAEAMKP